MAESERKAPWDFEKERPDVAVLVALQEETLALREVVGQQGFHARPHPTSPGHDYLLLAENEHGRPDRVVLYFMDDMGPVAAASAAHRLLPMGPRLMVNIGIACSLHAGDLPLGSVLVASQVDGYDERSKAADDGKEGWTWEFGGKVYNPTEQWSRIAGDLAMSHRESFEQWQARCATDFAALVDPARDGKRIDGLRRKGHLPEYTVVQRGHVATGVSVAAAAAFKKKVLGRDRNIKALEMEAAGMLRAAREQIPVVDTLVIKGVSDLGDANKTQVDAIGPGAIRKAAMRNAVRLLWALMREGLLPQVEGEERTLGRALDVRRLPPTSADASPPALLHGSVGLGGPKISLDRLSRAVSQRCELSVRDRPLRDEDGRWYRRSRTSDNELRREPVDPEDAPRFQARADLTDRIGYAIRLGDIRLYRPNGSLMLEKESRQILFTEKPERLSADAKELLVEVEAIEPYLRWEVERPTPQSTLEPAQMPTLPAAWPAPQGGLGHTPSTTRPTQNDLIDALAKTCDSGMAEVLLQRIEYPRGRAPLFENGLVFWTKIVVSLPDVIGERGLRALVEAAAAQFEGNAVFKSYLADVGPTGARDEPTGRPRSDAIVQGTRTEERPPRGAGPRSEWERRVVAIIARKIDAEDGLLVWLGKESRWSAAAKNGSTNVAEALLAEDEPVALIRGIRDVMTALVLDGTRAAARVEAMNAVLFLALPFVAGRSKSPRQRAAGRAWSIKADYAITAEAGMARGDGRPMEVVEWRSGVDPTPRAYVTPETPEGGVRLEQRVRDMRDALAKGIPVETHDLNAELARGVLKASKTTIPTHQQRDTARIINRAKPRVSGARSGVDPSCLLTYYTLLVDENDRDLAEMLVDALEKNELGGLRVLVSDIQDRDRAEEDEIEYELEEVRAVYDRRQGSKP